MISDKDWDDHDGTLDENGFSTDESIELVRGWINSRGEDAFLLDLLGTDYEMYNGTNQEITLDGALQLYLRSHELDPMFPEACISLGFYYDIFTDDSTLALKYFNLALEMEDHGCMAHYGKARILTETNGPKEALRFLDSSRFKGDDQILNLYKEIKMGIWNDTQQDDAGNGTAHQPD